MAKPKRGRVVPTVSLPPAPRETEFEEFISAFVQCSGRYVERNIQERNPSDICELDIVATDHTPSRTQSVVVEVKSGKLGFNDIFTLKGKSIFLNADNTVLVSLEDPNDRLLKESVANRLGVNLVFVGAHSQAEEALKTFFGDVTCSQADIATWRYVYWVERVLCSHLFKLRKKPCSRQGPGIAWDSLLQLRTNAFQLDMLTRTDKIYTNFLSNPKLTAKWAAELDGKEWDEEHDRIPRDTFRKAFYGTEVHELNIPAYVEHRSRICILKNLIEYAIYKQANDHEKINTKLFSACGLDVHKVDILPCSFVAALNSISKQPYFHRYAILWQWFINVFGCFILLDYEDREYQELSRVSGIPVEHIPQSLKAFDMLFPTDGGWFRDLPSARIKVLALSPTPLLGIGANYRRFLYATDHRFESLTLAETKTRDVLIRWNKCIVTYLHDKQAGAG